MPRPEPDTLEGNYYVSVRDGGRVGLLVGPFSNDHSAALRFVDAARDAAFRVDPKAWFYACGTARMPRDFDRPGVLNADVGFETPTALKRHDSTSPPQS